VFDFLGLKEEGTIEESPKNKTRAGLERDAAGLRFAYSMGIKRTFK
jgi:hypothetical protein